MLELNDANFVISSPHLRCNICNNLFLCKINLLNNLFINKKIHCRECRSELDLWESFSRTICSDLDAERVSSFIGYKTKIFYIYLKANETIEVDFSKYGLSSNSRVIRVNYTPQGSAPVHPIEIHSNDVPLRRASVKAYLYGRPWPGQSISSQPTKICVYVNFFESTEDEHAQSELARAFANFMAGEFSEMVVPAIVSIEFLCKKLIHDLKDKIPINKKSIKDKDLLNDVIIKIFSKELDAPGLPNNILYLIKRLWGQRDKISHEGKIYQPYLQEHAGPQLAAAIFVFQYLKILRILAKMKGLINSDFHIGCKFIVKKLP